ncbi:LysR family transcriptional regulator [Sphingomonas koreensis]|nr:LysR family transcriptional regulator [Sphingomonas koreensis]
MLSTGSPRRSGPGIGSKVADKFEDLRNFAAVVENGGVNAAAAALGIAKSAVSRRLGELEARLGVSLVERSTRRFEPTALGRDYYTKATTILAALDALDAGMGDSAVVSTVKVMSEPSLMTSLVAPALASFLICG